MSNEKPVHIPRDQYPQSMYPEVIETTGRPYEENEIQLLDYWRVIVARRWVILAVLFTVVTATMIHTLKQTPMYRATAVIQIDRENPNILAFKDVIEVDTYYDDTLRTQFEVLKSRSLARRVIEELRLASRAPSVPQEPGVFDAIVQLPFQAIGSLKSVLKSVFRPAGDVDKDEVAKEDDSDPLRPFINDYLGRLTVTPVRSARLVEVSFASEDPELAAQIINAHAKNYIGQNLQFKFDATQDAAEFLKTNLETLKGTLEKSEDRLQAYSRQNGIIFTDEGRNTATEKLGQLEEEYTRVQAERFQKESYNHLIRSGDTDALPQVANSALISELTGALNGLQREEAQISVTFGPGYPLRTKITNQMEQVKKAIEAQKTVILSTIRAEYLAAVQRERLLGDELAKQRQVVERVNQEIIQYNIMKREVDSNRELYDGLLTRLKEAGVSAGLKASNIRVVDRAETPQGAFSPNTRMNLLLSIVVGLLLGVGCAFAQEYLDNTVKTPDDVSRYLRVPTLGMVPKLESLNKRRGYGYGGAYAHRHRQDANSFLQTRTSNVDRIAHEFPLSLMSEAYRSIRTSLLLSSPDHPPKSIVVTSAAPSEGKTVTAVNLAVSLTQTGAKVVIIDADMRKPRVHSIFALGTSKGLSAFLAGTALLKEVIYETDVPGLLVIPCGVTPPNPGELIVSARFRRMLEALREYFDYMILDSPPVSHVSDPRVLASIADSSILVVKAFSTSRHQSQHAIEHLSKVHARIGGVVLNDVDVRQRSHYSGYSYYPHYPPSDSSSEQRQDKAVS